MADSLYNNGKYKKSLRLWEQIVPLYRGKPQAERVMYSYANTYYELEDFYTAGYQFDRFVKAYPQSTKREEAAFKSAESFFNGTRDYYLDQSDTYKALEKLNEFIASYPESELITEANAKVALLNQRLERKELEIAKQYHKIGRSQFTYPSAMKALDNFIFDNPGSKFKEEAYYYKLDAAYQYAIGSRDLLIKERLEKALDVYASMVRYYPESAYSKELDKIKEDIDKRLKNLQAN